MRADWVYAERGVADVSSRQLSATLAFTACRRFPCDRLYDGIAVRSLRPSPPPPYIGYAKDSLSVEFADGHENDWSSSSSSG